jgi:hypothetical protein
MRHYLEVVYWDAEQFSPVKPSALAREAESGDAHCNADAGGLGPGSGNEAKDVARLAKLRKRLRQAISASNGVQVMHCAEASISLSSEPPRASNLSDCNVCAQLRRASTQTLSKPLRGWTPWSKPEPPAR